MLTIFKILILLSAITVGKILLEIYRNRKCPPHQELKDAVLGGSGKRYEFIIKHLGTCQECQEKVKQLNEN